ncbi:hypothetical protein [Rhodanobacter geophilus]|uniref:YCII-related domain-containing protein n=1 Tax=Rhodanobacter geophilus TaxID=3162488 RepID=A0ABV3QLU0_9GAMM
MGEYLIYFNQPWVGEHSERWFKERGPLAMVVVHAMKAAGVYVFAGGAGGGSGCGLHGGCHPRHAEVHRRPYVRDHQFLGGFTVIDVADEQAARQWAGKLAEACGWPQEVRRFKPRPEGRAE